VTRKQSLSMGEAVTLSLIFDSRALIRLSMLSCFSIDIKTAGNRMPFLRIKA